MFLGNKGIYSILSGFMLIIIVIAAILFMIYLGASSIASSATIAQQMRPLQEGNGIKEKILVCWNGLKESALEKAVGNECLSKQISGYKIKILDFLGCQSKEFDFGATSECSKNFPYFVRVENKSGQQCLSQLILCFGGI